MRLALFMLLCNGPLAWIVFSDTWDSWAHERRAAKARQRGTCQRRMGWVPGQVCGQPIAARVDIYQGYEFRFFQWLCHEHAIDLERRASVPRMTIDWEQAYSSLGS